MSTSESDEGTEATNPYAPEDLGTHTVSEGATCPRLYVGLAACRQLGVEAGDEVRIEPDGENAIRVVKLND